MTSDLITGYLHSQYAESLSEFGAPRNLPRSGAWILVRPTATLPYFDAMGCYPLFSCANWSTLQDDLNDLESQIVSLMVVTDPFGHYDESYLQDCFRDVVVPFKKHFVTDLTRSRESFLSVHHQRNIRKARSVIRVEECDEPASLLNEWISLYETLVRRHGITGIPAFSSDSFAKQFKVPGLVVFRAVRNNQSVGMLLWFVQSNVSYYHLGAYSELGYESGASFALFDHSIDYFAQHGIKWLNLGAAPGAGLEPDSGLARFKQGWSTGTRTAYLCGRVLDEKKYDEIVKKRNITATSYFPAYRVGEFS